MLSRRAAAIYLRCLGIYDGRCDIGTVGVQAIPLHVMTPEAILQGRANLGTVGSMLKCLAYNRMQLDTS